MSLVLCAVDSSPPASHPHSQLLFISIFACAREAGDPPSRPRRLGGPAWQPGLGLFREQDDMSVSVHRSSQRWHREAIVRVTPGLFHLNSL